MGFGPLILKWYVNFLSNYSLWKVIFFSLFLHTTNSGCHAYFIIFHGPTTFRQKKITKIDNIIGNIKKIKNFSSSEVQKMPFFDSIIWLSPPLITKEEEEDVNEENFMIFFFFFLTTYVEGERATIYQRSQASNQKTKVFDPLDL